jgi:hypothetical protein
MEVKVIDHGFDKYKKAIEELHSKQIQVGMFAKVGDKVLTKAIVNEFGTTQAGKNNDVTIPERSFIRSTYNRQYKKVGKRFDQIFVSISKGNYNIIPRLKLIGLEQETETKKTITDMRTPENAESTIAKKGSSHPLIDTGEMRSKISHEVKNK